MPPRFTLLLAAALASAAGAARADVVTLRDGRTLEGSVTHEGEVVVVRHRFGEVRVPAAEVAQVEDTPDAWDELLRLRAELAGGTADQRYRLAVFCREHGFEDDARRAFLSVLRLDIDHPGARAALGYVRHEGRWVTRADRARALGLVEHRGAWVTPEEKAAQEAGEREALREQRAAQEAERAAVRAERRERREAERAARRERLAEAERERQRARATAAIDAELARNRRGTYVLGDTALGAWLRYPRVDPYAFYGRTALWGCGSRATRSVVVVRSGAELSGSVDGGRWQLRWRLGY